MTLGPSEPEQLFMAIISSNTGIKMKMIVEVMSTSGW